MHAILIALLVASAPDSARGDTLAWALRPAATIAPQGDGRGQVLEPSGVAVDAFGRIVVADAAVHRLQRFDADGRWMGESGSLGSDAGQLRRPESVAMLGALTVAVLDRENRRVESYDVFGHRLGTIVDLQSATLTDQTGRIEPIALTADRGGALYVADGDRDRVLVFDATGTLLRTIGGFGARPGSFRGLAGLAARGARCVSSTAAAARSRR
ncbi:MAG: NHL repeat-containing protein [Candidatus Eisenbacteria bacterium]|uniref:NHL repeat-containing protein n=1 Tax=Eiseniibacteriota bacterium TaxID=2212470 RepID=A0A9D6L4P2_UNCEI|nr:NHL repeat-containing protein [Candidatus Eisenbacteria bacterium]